MRASIVVPTRDRAQSLARTLDDLLAQDVPAEEYEIVVVDDGSAEPVAARDRVEVVRHDEPRGPNAARNSAIRVARGELVCFVDDDVSVPPGWLREMLAAFERHPDAACLGGRVLIDFERPPPRVCEGHNAAYLGSPGFDLGDEERAIEAKVQSCNMAVPARVLERVGGFPEEQPIYFDEHAWQRQAREAGETTFVYVPRAWLRHRRTASDVRVLAILRRRYRFGVGSAVYRNGYEPRALARRLLGVGGLLRHSVRHRCFAGVAISAAEVGILVGSLRVRRRA